MAENTGKQNLQNADTIAKLFGLGVRRVEQLAQQKIIHAAQTRPYMFDLLPTIQTYIHHLSERANGKEKSAEVVNIERKKMEAEADLKRSKADMAALQLKELEGEMHRGEDVAAMTTDLVFAVRSMFMALPGRLAVDVSNAGSAAEASVIIRTECNKMLEDLSNYEYDPEAYRRRVRDREGWSELLADEADD